MNRTDLSPFHSAHGPRVKLWISIIGIGLLIAIIAVNRLSTSWSRGTSASPLTAEQQDRRSIELVGSENAALARTSLLAAADLGKKALDEVASFEAEIKRWDNEISPLLNNDKGRFIAANKEQLQAFIVLYEKPRPSMADAAAIRERIKTALKPVNDALAESETAYRPDSAVAVALQREKGEAEKASQLFRERRETIQAFLPATQTPPPAAAPLLSAAIDTLKREQAREQATKISAAEEQARHERDDRLATARGEAIRQETEEKAKDMAVQGQLDKTKADYDRRKKLATDPVIMRQYLPFLAKGRVRVGYTPARWFDIPSPVSYNDLQKTGILNDAMAFAKAGAGHHSCFDSNDRPRWKLPNNEEEVKEYGRLLRQFNDLAPIWIESGVLLP